MCIDVTTFNTLSPQDWASWLSAIGTVGAFFVALWLLYIQMRDRNVSAIEDKEKNARKVSCWCDSSKDEITLWVQNLSDEPVYNLVAYAGRMGVNLEVLPEPGNMYIETVFGIVPPETKLNYSIDEALHHYIEGEMFPDITEVAVEFTDAKEQHWRRMQSGQINKIEYRRPFD